MLPLDESPTDQNGRLSSTLSLPCSCALSLCLWRIQLNHQGGQDDAEASGHRVFAHLCDCSRGDNRPWFEPGSCRYCSPRIGLPPTSNITDATAAPVSVSNSRTECVPVVFVHSITGSGPNFLLQPGGYGWFRAPATPLFNLFEANGYEEGKTLVRFSYNWLASNATSAAALGPYIEEVKDAKVIWDRWWPYSDQTLGDATESLSVKLASAPTRRDRCGSLIKAVFDEPTCNWKWPRTNTTCLLDDNRSVAGLAGLLDVPVSAGAIHASTG
jgi:hypothetical protein